MQIYFDTINREIEANTLQTACPSSGLTATLLIFDKFTANKPHYIVGVFSGSAAKTAAYA
jgi:hypothetical protein